ncbi:MAG: electron transfer flavoprotein subunit alpha/FixB family protein [Bryocella sp.]
MILVVASATNGRLSSASSECVAAARELGDDVAMLVLGSGVNAVAADAAKLADQVLVADVPSLARFNEEVWAAAVAQIAREGEATAVLVPASRSGRSFSPRVAVKLSAPLLEDVISLKREGTKTTAQRYSYLARVTETVEADAAAVVISVKPGAFAAATPRAEAAEQFDVELEPSSSRIEVSDERHDASGGVALGEAKVVVAGGRGVGSAEAFDATVVPLAKLLGAAVGATRAVVDAGWRPYTEQVGQTGKTVQPEVYVAVGISGATQHLSGMNKSKIVIAINKDPDAPIFRVADYGVVGDAGVIVPALLKRLQQ